ncbi:metallophosphoesterase family protein [Actinoplanes xinjiangensis]|uniref:3',5'-cyclic AMP phosphodiesterase CpdA n=1 Tax=Actinoplanes xinjiangensis TaxID=512350 RepID=A0A316FFF9_9ACTN|nr:metallophosphoesterase [Actinoplanes xinjiangensis]PWK47129.1 3',5'-cyclic AMP phosphodiesterase CpdA [Actinoplanes xinjiangensis]GIF40287.1 metallophosphoesterase [Actinoplanes xinjiangensis]
MNRPAVVAHLSDLHIGAHYGYAVDSIVADVTAARPDLVVVTGDLTMRARESEFRQARDLLGRLPGPVLAVTGNHDLPLASWRRVVRPYRRWKCWIDADPQPVRRAGAVTALGLTSMPRWRWKNGRVSARQAGDVVRVLGAAPTGDVRVLALHHPPLATGTAALIGRDRLLDAVRAARVDLVLAGHTHVPDVRTRAGTVFVVAGTATSRRLRGTGCSWSLISVGTGQVVVRERMLGPDGWRTGRLTENVVGRRRPPAPGGAAGL